MKKEIIVCDICCKNTDDIEDFVKATEKCELCGKEICEDCCSYLKIVDEEEEIEIFFLTYCNDCEEGTRLNKKEDKKIIKEVKEILLNHIKKKVLIKNLK